MELNRKESDTAHPGRKSTVAIKRRRRCFGVLTGEFGDFTMEPTANRAVRGIFVKVPFSFEMGQNGTETEQKGGGNQKQQGKAQKGFLHGHTCGEGAEATQG